MRCRLTTYLGDPRDDTVATTRRHSRVPYKSSTKLMRKGRSPGSTAMGGRHDRRGEIPFPAGVGRGSYERSNAERQFPYPRTATLHARRRGWRTTARCRPGIRYHRAAHKGRASSCAPLGQSLAAGPATINLRKKNAGRRSSLAKFAKEKSLRPNSDGVSPNNGLWTNGTPLPGPRPGVPKILCESPNPSVRPR